MTLSEHAAYLKGLMDGLSLDAEKPEGKMIGAIVAALTDAAAAIDAAQEEARAASRRVEQLEDELDFLHDLASGDDYDDGEDGGYDDETVYEFKCPNCGERVTIDEEQLDLGSMACPGCGETLEFEPPDDSEED